MKKALFAAAAMMALGSGYVLVSGAHAIEAGPEPVRPRKRIRVESPVYRSPRGRLPHIGAKERARHAGKPDGPMHGLPLLHRKGE